MRKEIVVAILIFGIMSNFTACSDKEIDTMMSKIEDVAKDVDANISDLEVKSFMAHYFEAVCNVDDIESSYRYVGEEFFELNSELIAYLAMPYYVTSADEYAPLAGIIQNFSYKITDVTYPNEDTAKVTVKIENADVYKIAENALNGQKIDELRDGGLNKFLERELERKYPTMSVSVVFELKKKNGDWTICTVDSEEDLVLGISGNMKKLLDTISESEIDKADAYREYQDGLNQEYEKMFGDEESSFVDENGFDKYEDNYSDDIDYSNNEYEDTYDDFILPYSDSEYLDWSDLEDLSAEECQIARNEIYARHGRRFSNENLQAHFEKYSWYNGTIDPEDFSDEVLSEIEKANLQLIVEYEKEMGY